MSEPLEIVAAVEATLAGDTTIPLSLAQPPVLAGLRVIVTSGPTHEPIDPVRYIANRSSGKQGHAIAKAAADAGASVVLVSGPVSVPDPAGVQTLHVETARQMLEAVEAALPADIFIGAAAVADWRVGAALAEKLKKGASGPPTLGFVENPDILATVASHARRPRLVVGFAAETEKVIDHAQAKLARKKCDLIVANDVSPATGVMGGDANTVHLVSKSGVETWPTLPKAEVAQRLIAQLAAIIRESGA
jgi:phosphopantothenoylcysteine decarboxylase/phosphopantothenate--cysteine ligase